ncbi:MAG TPA: DUF4861 family protein [Burkholderiales bacterium]|nr:DUF4861 family protein [Burkholderiales bacterium]
MTRKPLIPAVAAFVLIAWAAAARGQTQGPTSLGFKKRFVIEIRNPGPAALENHLVVLSVEGIRAFAPDFNSYNYAIFDETGGGYRLVPSQADDLNQDRAHEEIVFIRTLPAASTTALACYYSPKGGFQLMMSTPKAGARLLGSGPAGVLAGWESNLAGFKFVDGRVEAYGKLYPGLVLSKAVKDDAKLQEWGLDILAGGASLGLGGLSAWEGGSAVPLAGAGAGGGFTVQRTVLASGPLRASVKVEYSAPKPGARGSGTVVLFSAFADNIFCRQDIHPGPDAGRPGVYGVGLQKLAGEDVSFDRNRGFLCTWGRGAEAVGEVGLAVLFDPSDLAGLDENGPARTVKLNAKPGRTLTVWTVAGWGRGIVTAAAPAAKNWARLVADLGIALRVPVEIRFKER